MTVGEAVRSLRKRAGKSQSEFAEILGCQRNTISRYELGAFPPGPLVLIQLLGIAEESGANEEKNAVMHELKAYHQHNLIGGGKSADETVAMMRLVGGATLREQQKAGTILAALPAEKMKDLGFRQFVPAVTHVVEACETVDESVSDLLNLWAAHWSKPNSTQSFRDAVAFLRFQLFGKAGTKRRQEDHAETQPK